LGGITDNRSYGKITSCRPASGWSAKTYALEQARFPPDLFPREFSGSRWHEVAEDESSLGVPLDADIAAMELDVLEKTMLQIYWNYSVAFERHKGQLFSAEIDADGYPLDNIKRIALLLEQEEARAIPILFCAYVDDILLEMYQRELPDGIPGGKKSLFNSYGPFSNFASRLKLAYCFKMIGLDLLKDIDVVRKIRNDISHMWDTSILANYFSDSRAMGMVDVANFLDYGGLSTAHLDDLSKLRLRLIWIATRTTYECRYYYKASKKGLNPARILYTETPPKLLGKMTKIAWDSSQRLAKEGT
jgi:hypothetical protein